MGKASSASFSPTLTSYAQGIAQDVASRLAEFLAPEVDTGGAITGGYKKYDEKNAFQALDYARAIGGTFKRIEFEQTDGTFKCKPVGLEIPLDDDEVEEGVGGQRLAEAKVRTLVTTAHISREVKVLTAVAAGVSAEAGKGVYSDPDVDPIKEIDEQIETLATVLGAMPNRLALGIGAWRVLKNHPKVLARQPGSLNQSVTLDQFANMLLNPAIQIKVGMLSKDTTKFGKTASKTNIVGARLYIFFGADNPTVYDASFAKTFTTKKGGVDSVETYREEGVTSDIHRVRWSEDIAVCTSAAAKRIDIS